MPEADPASGSFPEYPRRGGDNFVTSSGFRFVS
nr:MAG TPA: hypothetical protein [Caudoviricetes sp.]